MEQNEEILQSGIAMVKEKLFDGGYAISSERGLVNGYQLKLSGGEIVNVYTTGTVVVNGKPNKELKKLFNYIVLHKWSIKNCSRGEVVLGGIADGTLAKCTVCGIYRQYTMGKAEYWDGGGNHLPKRPNCSMLK